MALEPKDLAMTPAEVILESNHFLRNGIEAVNKLLVERVGVDGLVCVRNEGDGLNCSLQELELIKQVFEQKGWLVEFSDNDIDTSLFFSIKV